MILQNKIKQWFSNIFLFQTFIHNSGNSQLLLRVWLYFSVGIPSGFGLKNTEESVYGSCIIKKNKQATKNKDKEGYRIPGTFFFVQYLKGSFVWHDKVSSNFLLVRLF